MRTPWIAAPAALRARMMTPAQVTQDEPEAAMPPYMESFLAHLRVLVGVPFEYLVPDARLLPPESIRFFYLDRSWADRLVDGAVAVGKIGTREQAHHQAHEPAVRQQLDVTERIVRRLQRHVGDFPSLKAANDADPAAAGVVTGFVLRSSAVSGWPHMDVRAYTERLQEPFDPADPAAQAKQLPTLRLERLAPSVLIALFDGVPQLVICEEPHHGVQFGVHATRRGFGLDLRSTQGWQVPSPQNPDSVGVPVRAAHGRVVHVTELRRRLASARTTHATMPEQTGSAAFAIEVLQPPWRQRFEGTVDHAHEGEGGGLGFVSTVKVGVRVTDVVTQRALIDLVGR